MKVLNLHERTLPVPAEAAGALIDTLASSRDRLWPVAAWPPMRFGRPLAIGAAGGHGPIRYVVETYQPGERITFRFTSPRGFDGIHGFECAGDNPTRLRHTLAMQARGMVILSWPLFFRPLHDALLEDALATAQASLGLVPEIHAWSPWVRLLRLLLGRGRARPQVIAGRPPVSDAAPPTDTMTPGTPPPSPIPATLFADLGISPDAIAARSLQPHPEPQCLEVAETGTDGRAHQLTPAAAAAWRALKAAALADGVALCIVSAFRSVERQAAIIRRKLDAGQDIDAILAVSAPPGFSEHHTGCAVDISTPGAPALEADFEATPAFAWLVAHAADFGFCLSYPAGNPQGYNYEPWHWCYRPEPG